MGILEDIEGGAGKQPGEPPAQSSLDAPLGGVLGEIEAQAAVPPPPSVTAETPWSEVLAKGARNIPGDYLRTGKEIIGAVGSGVGHLAKYGPIESGKHLRGALAGADWGKIGSELKHDYLTEEGWKQGIAERPVSRLLDVSMLAAGPEALAARAALKAGHTGLAKGISIASKAHDPAAWTIGATKFGLDKGSRLANEFIGHTFTHTGGTPLNLLRDAGREGGAGLKAAWAGLTGKGNATDPVRGFQGAMNEVRDKGYSAYKADKNALRRDLQRFDFTPIDNAVAAAQRDFIGQLAVNPDPQVIGALGKIRDLVGKQKQAAAAYDYAQAHALSRMQGTPIAPHRGPNPYRDPLAMDELKQAIDDQVISKTDGKARAAAIRIKDVLSDEIKTRSPTYDKMMKDYSAMRDAYRAYETELSLNKSPDTALRKLLSSLRDNVSTNFLRRWQLVERLAKDNPAARAALYNLAGQSASAWWPRGLVGSFQSAGTGAATLLSGLGHFGVVPWLSWLHPAFLAALPMQSPKVMGALNLAEGMTARALSKVPWRPIAYAGHVAGSPYADIGEGGKFAGEQP